jgi:hypothetical protein
MMTRTAMHEWTTLHRVARLADVCRVFPICSVKWGDWVRYNYASRAGGGAKV